VPLIMVFFPAFGRDFLNLVKDQSLHIRSKNIDWNEAITRGSL